ncbi:helix-turn-helix domain-containing protein [Embleya sp. NPDC059237]|uniref:helix-turn-helix domain-containing protein n=1 Tax=Embleya sp. NPDC059237 TaxID=3346784 RepID=UPI00367A82B4
MTLAWAPVADAIRKAREHMKLTQDELAVRADVQRATITNLEGGYTYTRIPTTIEDVGAVLGWPDPMNTARRIANGEPPPPLRTTPVTIQASRRKKKAQGHEPSDARPALARGMPLRVKRQLGHDNQVVDSKIIEIDGLKVVVLLMAPEDAEVSDGQLASGAALWSELEARERNMNLTGSDQDDS